MGVLIIGAIIFSLIYIGNLKKENTADKSQDTLISDFNSSLHTYEIPIQSGFNVNQDIVFKNSISFLILLFLIIKTNQLNLFFKINNQKVI